jgi:hypothetical protein
MLNPESVADLKARLDALKDEIRDREEERTHIEALLKMWKGRSKNKRVALPRPAQPVTDDPESARKLRHEGVTKQDRIVKEVLKHLLEIPTHSADFPEIFRLLDPDLVGSGPGAKEYTRTSILRLGGIYGVVYGKGGRLWLDGSRSTGIVDPFEGAPSNPFEAIANGESPFHIGPREGAKP